MCDLGHAPYDAALFILRDGCASLLLHVEESLSSIITHSTEYDAQGEIGVRIARETFEEDISAWAVSREGCVWPFKAQCSVVVQGHVSSARCDDN